MLPSGNRRRATGLAVALTLVAAGCHERVVSEDPVNWTPHVLDGQVAAVAEVGSTVFLGGNFSSARNDDSSTVLPRSNFLAFDADTGVIGELAPQFDGRVDDILAAPDGQSIYVSGWFTHVDGQPFRSLVRLDVDTGEPVAGFTVPPITGRVRDIHLVDGRLWLAGAFTHVGGVFQPGLATIDADTGAHDPFMALPVSGNQAGGTTQVLAVDATPDGHRLFAVGNFSAVGGVVARQVVALDIDGPVATLADWSTSFYAADCSQAFDTYMRDVSVSPDGAWVVFVTTGGFLGGPPRPCDTIARFAVDDGAGATPDWVDYTGGDTISQVLYDDSAVYVGGHSRWVNNPRRSAAPGAGAVDRQGLAALDPDNGLPLPWDPGRTLGEGVFDFEMTDRGLWMTSDTDRVFNFELHGRVALFPPQGGPVLLHGQVGKLPGRVVLVSPPSAPGSVQGRTFDGQAAGPVEALSDGGIDWSLLRAAVMIDGRVYAAFGDTAGTFTSAVFAGTGWGPFQAVDGADQLVVDTAWHTDVRNLTGLFFERGWLYYTLSGSSTLFRRAFTPEGGVVGAERLVASSSVTGISFGSVRGIFPAGGHLYWTTSDGDLRRIGWSDGAPVPGTAQLLSGPTIDGVDWRAAALFLDTNRPAG